MIRSVCSLDDDLIERYALKLETIDGRLRSVRERDRCAQQIRTSDECRLLRCSWSQTRRVYARSEASIEHLVDGACVNSDVR